MRCDSLTLIYCLHIFFCSIVFIFSMLRSVWIYPHLAPPFQLLCLSVISTVEVLRVYHTAQFYEFVKECRPVKSHFIAFIMIEMLAFSLIEFHTKLILLLLKLYHRYPLLSFTSSLTAV